MVEKRNEGLLFEGRASPNGPRRSPRGWWGVVRLEDGALLLEADPKWAGAINAVLVEKGVRVKEIRKQTTAAASLLLEATALPS